MRKKSDLSSKEQHPELHKIELWRQNTTLMACTSVCLWIRVFFFLYGLSWTVLFLVIYVSTSVLCIVEYVSKPVPPYFFTVFWVLQTRNAHTYLFCRSQSSSSRISDFPCKPFASPSWPAGIYYKLQLHVLPFVIHQSRQPYWNIAVVLPAAWMRLTGTFLGLQ